MVYQIYCIQLGEYCIHLWLMQYSPSWMQYIWYTTQGQPILFNYYYYYYYYYYYFILICLAGEPEDVVEKAKEALHAQIASKQRGSQASDTDDDDASLQEDAELENELEGLCLFPSSLYHQWPHGCHHTWTYWTLMSALYNHVQMDQ